MHNYILVSDIMIDDELIYIFDSHPTKNQDIIDLKDGIMATYGGVSYTVLHPDRIRETPYHSYIDIIYTDDECIIPQKYTIATYTGGKGYNIKYLEELVI